jgi:parallel beta-helix repeat protein
MKKATVIALMITVLLLTFIPILKAQQQNVITINTDGTVTPQTAPIKQVNDVYMLTGDYAGTIYILRSNIIFEGDGYTLTPQGPGAGGLNVGNNYSTDYTSYVENVTIKNLNVYGSIFGITLSNTSNCLIVNNTLSKINNGVLSLGEPTAAIFVAAGYANIIRNNTMVDNFCGIDCLETQGNLIVGNTIANNSKTFWNSSCTAIMFWGASNNTIYHNNFINNSIQAYDDSYDSAFSVNTWDNGYFSGGNYWSDYQTKYPNAGRLNDSAIGNGAYIIDSQNRDNYPLLEPFNPANEVEASPTPNQSPLSNQMDFTTLEVTVGATAILAVAALTVYCYKRKRPSAPD